MHGNLGLDIIEATKYPAAKCYYFFSDGDKDKEDLRWRPFCINDTGWRQGLLRAVRQGKTIQFCTRSILIRHLGMLWPIFSSKPYSYESNKERLHPSFGILLLVIRGVRDLDIRQDRTKRWDVLILVRWWGLKTWESACWMQHLPAWKLI